MRKLLLVFLLFLVSLVGLVVLFNTFTVASRQSNIPFSTDLPTYPNASAHLAEAIRYPTTNDSTGKQAVQRFYKWVQQTYPALFNHPKVEWQLIGAHTWVMKWMGHIADDAPIVLVASPEVAYPNTEQLPEWVYDPFLGKYDSTFIYGQGVQGGKAAMVALLEVLNDLVPNINTPSRTLYIAFPYPAEKGQQALLQTLSQAGIHPSYILATGGGVHKSGWASIKAPIARLGTGHLAGATYQLIRQDSTALWASALPLLRSVSSPLDCDHPMVTTFLADLVPELATKDRIFFANTWLLPFRKGYYFSDSSFLQSTLGHRLTLSTSPQSHIAKVCLYAPSLARLPSVEHLNEGLAQTPFRIQSRQRTWPAQATALANGRLYHQLSNTCKEVFPNLLTAASWAAVPAVDSLPFPMFYFHPVVYTPRTWQKAQRGITEQLPQDAYQKWLQFYQRLIVHVV